MQTAFVLRDESTGAVVEVSRRTPLTQMIERVLLIHMVEVYKTVAESLGLPPEVIDEAMTTFARISARVTNASGLDFAFATQFDMAATIEKKFSDYLSTQYYTLLEDVIASMKTFDSPNKVTIQPAPLPANAPKNS